MAKKKIQNRTDVESGSLDLSKGFGGGAFDSLKTLQNIRKTETEEKAAAAQMAAQEAARRREEKAREEASLKRDLRFTEEDLNDRSGMTDDEIFEAFMRDDRPLDVYEHKFAAKEKPKPPQEPEHLTMSDEEKEFAIFTQEMAISNVRRLQTPTKPVHKVRNKGKYKTAQALLEHDVVSVHAAPQKEDAGMHTNYVAPTVTVTQADKGDDIVEHPDIQDAITLQQRALLREVKRHEARYGLVVSLKLRGLTLNAAMSRLDAFIDDCIAARKTYGLIICGKGLGSAGVPVIKEATTTRLRNDDRISEYVPVINDDGDFGSIYVSFKLK